MADSPEHSRTASQRPPLEAVAKDEERRVKAKKDLVRLLQSYINQLDHPKERDAHKETEIFCVYARENYASRAVPYFETVSPIDPQALFRQGEESKREDLSDLGELSGLATIGDVSERIKTVKVQRPDHWPDPAGHWNDTPELGRSLGRLLQPSFRWLREEPYNHWFWQQIRDCVKECVRDTRKKYEQRFPYPPEAKPNWGGETALKAVEIVEPPVNGSSMPQPMGKENLGRRPQTIADEKKTAAAELKASSSTNKQAAGKSVALAHSKVSTEVKKHRLDLIHRYRKDHDQTMADFARHCGASLTAIYGMVKGDRTRYSEGKLLDFLKTIRVSPDQW